MPHHRLPTRQMGVRTSPDPVTPAPISPTDTTRSVARQRRATKSLESRSCANRSTERGSRPEHEQHHGGERYEPPETLGPHPPARGRAQAGRRTRGLRERRYGRSSITASVACPRSSPVSCPAEQPERRAVPPRGTTASVPGRAEPATHRVDRVPPAAWPPSRRAGARRSGPAVRAGTRRCPRNRAPCAFIVAGHGGAACQWRCADVRSSAALVPARQLRT